MGRYTLAVLVGIFALASGLGAAESKTVTGEIVDMACYAKSADNVAPGHSACAMKCAQGGGALGILTADGVLAITGSMTNDNNAELLDYVAKNVKAMGDVSEEDGQMSINVSSVEAQ